ncbi:response regulator [Aestuariibaculum sp. M13]|uniref:response regulator n=1 Tax=Aestuariibaculum sp. M13 TaxID=2967132 RepID=UPI002159FEA0|nr:response regulator [Aestuariibaculum sp. M13]MCR8667457.1 response regulator [Aestuariibaculum sp. M13]
MNIPYNILIIDDHPMIIDAYSSAINNSELSKNRFEIKIETASCCNSAISKIENKGFNENLDLVILDISIPPCEEKKIFSGEQLGMFIKSIVPNLKILVITSYDDSLRINNILSNLNPDGFLVKKDISSLDLILAIETIISGHPFYSNTVNLLIKKRMANKIILDEKDLRILMELSNGSRMKELIDVVHLSKAGIEKRRRLLKVAFEVNGKSDRELILEAKKRGFL